MGAKLSLLAPHAQTVAVRAYVDVLPDFRFLDVCNESRFLKTIRAHDYATDTLVVMKVFVKPPLVGVRLLQTAENLAAEARKLSAHACVLPWCRLLETDLAGYLVRTLVRANLYDRMLLRPFLAPVEKAWLVFQLLEAVALLHTELGICHGDIKAENVLVTSANWLVLTDFSAHLKPTYLPHDNPLEFVFYFDSSQRRSCYLAPERMCASPKEGALTPEMDLFSVGCVIAELFNDGEPTFNLSSLFKYKRGESRPNFSHLGPFAALVTLLLAVDPTQRTLAAALLQLFRGKCFPEYFYTFLYPFVRDLNAAASSDEQLCTIYDNFDKIVEALGYTYESHSDPDHPALRLGLRGLPEGYTIRPLSALQPEPSTHEHGALLVLDIVFSLLKTLKRPENKIHACHIIVALSERVSDDAKLDRCVPHLCDVIDDFLQDSATSELQPSVRIAAVALSSLTDVLAACSTVSTINALVFPEYLNPKLKSIAFLQPASQIRSYLAVQIPYLAQIASRFCDSATPNTDLFKNPRLQIAADFKDITEAILTDSNANVRAALVSHILPLCRFFGVDKTNDLILPHLITYLNDPNYQLRLVFLDSIMKIGPFIGLLAVEQYLLPLLFQTLGDHEKLVVLKVLEIFHSFVSEGLIDPATEFNALSIYKELVTSSAPLLLQPNEWIRQSVLCLILEIAKKLSDADKFCFLYPLIKTYLSYDIVVLDWDTLYPCLTKPLSRQAFEMAATWASEVRHSLFWKQSKISAIGRSNGRRKLVTFSKDLGKSVYISSQNDPVSRKLAVEIPLSPEDRLWIMKLKSVGMDERDLWKVFALKEHFLSYTRSKANSQNSDQTEFQLATDMSIPPTNIFSDVCYKTEPLSQTRVLESVQTKRDVSLVIGKGSKALASLQTIEANVLGELEVGHATKNQYHHNHLHTTGQDSKSAHKVLSINREKLISAAMRHNFTGDNPYIVKYLQSVDFEPSIDDFVEFGSIVKSGENTTLQEINVQGALVANINASDSLPDCINKVVVGPTSEFFVTGSEQGHLKVWDTNKLERDVNVRAPALSADLKSPIKDIAFMPHRFVLAVALESGGISLFRLNVSRNRHRKIVRYQLLSLVRHSSVPTGYVTMMLFASTPSQTLLVGVTSGCTIVAFDVITMELVYEVENPLEHGVPSTFIVSRQCDWLLLGTKLGVLCLWDLRFKVFVKAWTLHVDSVASDCEISRLVLLPNWLLDESTHFAMMVGSADSDVTVWSIPAFECRHILASNANPIFRVYTLRPVESGGVERLLAALKFDVNQSSLHNILKYFRPRGLSGRGSIITATAKRLVIVWDTAAASDSQALSRSGNFTEERYSLKLTMLYENSTKDAAQITGQDVITDVSVLTRPSTMIVTVDRSGCICVYK